MPGTAEILAIAVIVIVAIIELAILIWFLVKIKQIEENTANTANLLQYIIEKNAASTLDEIENELNSNTRH